MNTLPRFSEAAAPFVALLVRPHNRDSFASRLALQAYCVAYTRHCEARDASHGVTIACSRAARRARMAKARAAVTAEWDRTYFASPAPITFNV